jgi:hypothetical protein
VSDLRVDADFQVEPGRQTELVPSRFGERLGWFAQHIPRRSFLGRVAVSVVAASIGAPVLEAVMVDRRTGLAGAEGNCGDWQNCGIDGKLCSQCGGASDNSRCPKGTTASGGCWSACCCGNEKSGYVCKIFSYCDCCGPSCSVSFCANAREPYWGCGRTKYSCTTTTTQGTKC